MIKVGSALLEYAEQLERERGIPKAFIIDSLREAMLAAYRRYAKLPSTEGLLCRLVEKSGEIGIFQEKFVVEKVVHVEAPEAFEGDIDAALEAVEALAEESSVEGEVQDEGPELSEEERAAISLEARKANPFHQISLQDARHIKADVQLDDVLEIDVTPSEFGRIAAQSAKQVITQRIREAEKLLIQEEFDEKKYTVVPAVVQRVEGRNVWVNIGRNDALLPTREQLPGEYYRVGNRIRAYVLELKDSNRMPTIVVSQAHPQMVREVFELEVPEIEDGLVEIKSIAREAGHRTKVAVHGTDGDVDPQGACIGTRGSRIQAIVSELRNEKIDIIRWSDNLGEFIANSLAPAHILEVRVDSDPELKRALIIVPDEQLSLAIGREGQNVRLAAKLTGFKLDIKSISQFQRLREEFFNRRAKAENDALEEGGEEAEALQEKILDGVDSSIPAEVE
ncbi:MAG: transcription termination factor NusA [Vampirovibrionales bacterium]|jgi:N utilization substance protein A|nr:transcription termination factor NusA [Vampirovibrionales bacterium]